VNVVTLPTAMLWAGHVPNLCVRHGATATVRMSMYRGTVQNWPYCAACVRSRRTSLVLAVAALVLPFVAMLAGIVLFSDDPKAQNVVTVFMGAGIITFWFLLYRYVTPSGLAKMKLTGGNMFLVTQGAHPAFAAHANALARATEGTYLYGEPTFAVAEGEIHM
jgi:hypothetical protein